MSQNSCNAYDFMSPDSSCDIVYDKPSIIYNKIDNNLYAINLNEHQYRYKSKKTG